MVCSMTLDLVLYFYFNVPYKYSMSYSAKTVFVLGAGVNKVMTNWVDISAPVSPPVMNDFFIVVSKLKRFNDNDFKKRIKPVYDFIKDNWSLSISELAYTSFNIEKCFGLLESKLAAANRSGDDTTARELFSIEFKLKKLLAEVLAEFDGVERNGVMRAFGQLLFRLRPIIITLNYDCFIETVVQIASGQTSTQHGVNGDISQSYWNWNLPRGYGIEFDYVMIHDRFTHHPLRRRYIDGNTFYRNPKNHLYPWHLLKLHGSLNWFRYVPKELMSSFVRIDSKASRVAPSHKSDIILGHLGLLRNEYPKINDIYVDPIIVTPNFNKIGQFASLPNRSKITQLWMRAEDALINCKNLIIIGYSFPHGDNDIRSLFGNAFSGNPPEELIIVNPNERHARTAFRLCKPERSVLYSNLRELLSHQFR